jgi:hypothetical protein
MRQLDPDLSSPRNNRQDEQRAARFDEARGHVRSAIRRAESAGISKETLAFALISEALPHIVGEHGPAWTAEVLTRLAQRIRAGVV